MKEVKLVPIAVCYFLPETGVKLKLLKFKSVSGEAAEILREHLLLVLDQSRLKKKLIGFYADNYNTNFGGIKKENKIMFSSKLKITLNGILWASDVQFTSFTTAFSKLRILCQYARKPCCKDL